jgi:hypothetical protein
MMRRGRRHPEAAEPVVGAVNISRDRVTVVKVDVE